jgi:hypothetical protein
VIDEKTGSVIHMPSNRTINFEFVQVVRDPGQVYVCASQLYERLDGLKVALPDMTLPDLTALKLEGDSLLLPGKVLMACQAVSLLCLALVLLTLCVFTELLTLHGKLTLGLTLSTFLAVLVPGVGAGRADELPAGWCVAVGVICHYCLLSAFCWLAASAYNAAREASREAHAQRQRQHGNKSGLFLKLVAVCAILPAVVVSVTLLVNHVVPSRHDHCQLRLGYGVGICFLSNAWSLWLAAVLPVCLVSVFCLASCVFTACTRRHVQAESGRTAFSGYHG